jgi:hypothetical protein
MVDGPPPLLDRDEVEIVVVGGTPDPSVLRARWTCPMCAQERLVVNGRFAVIRERNGAPMERQVLLCEACIEDAVGAGEHMEDWVDPSPPSREDIQAH